MNQHEKRIRAALKKAGHTDIHVAWVVPRSEWVFCSR